MVGLALMHLVPGLLLLGFAYIILLKAKKETGSLKMIGQLIGWGLVVVVILAGLSCGMKKSCPICHKNGMMAAKHCPVTGSVDKEAMMSKHCPMADKEAPVKK